MTPAATSWRALAALTVAVLALHWLALRATSGAFHMPDAWQTPLRFLVRDIVALPLPLPSPVAAPVPPKTDSATRSRQRPSADSDRPSSPPPDNEAEEVIGRPVPARVAILSVADEPRKPAAAAAAEGTPAVFPVIAREMPTAQGPSPGPAAPVVVGEAPPASVAGPQAPPEAAAPALQDREAAASAFTIPGSVRLLYEVTAQARGLSWQAQAQLHWRHDGEAYEARLEIKAPILPTRTQLSTGRITANGLAPTRFSDKSRSEEATHFERDKGKLTFSSNRPDAPLLAGAQDRLSVMLQLGAMIAGDPARYPAATTITVQTASTREADQWLFTVDAEEQLQLPGGSLRTLKLTRNPRREFDHKVELWLAPGMDYMPVRLRLTQPNGDWLDQQWSGTDRG